MVLGILAGFLGNTSFGAVTTLHVVLEHEASHRASAHAHHAGAETPEDQAHLRDLEAPRRAHHDATQVERGAKSGHTHALSLAAELLPRASRLSDDPSWTGPSHASRVLMGHVDRSPLRAAQRAGPLLTTPPLSRRSVVLQI